MRTKPVTFLLLSHGTNVTPAMFDFVISVNVTENVSDLQNDTYGKISFLKLIYLIRLNMKNQWLW